jgi:hypothetical protein
VFLSKTLKQVRKVIWDNPQFHAHIGLGVCVFFLPATFILGFEWCMARPDSFPGAAIVLPWAMGCSVFVLLIGLSLVFLGTRWSAIPGTFLHRITHWRNVRRG